MNRKQGMLNYFKDHWTGQLGFGMTLFANLLALSFAVSSLAIEDWPFWAANLAVATIAILLTWQIVGGLRWASIAKRDPATGGDALGVYFGITVAVAMMSFQMLDVVAKRYFIEPRFKTIFGDDDFTAVLKRDTIYLGGEVNYLMYHAMLIILSEHAEVKAVSLESQGGIVFAGRTIGKLIEEKQLDTQVETYCYSVCTLVFAAGQKRIVQEGAKIGFHGYSFDIPGRFPTVDPIEEQKKDQIYLESRGIEAGFLKRAFGTDSKTLWKPTRAELYEAGFITDP
jgi:ATP-dependent protease ClpP protease subunit